MRESSAASVVSIPRCQFEPENLRSPLSLILVFFFDAFRASVEFEVSTAPFPESQRFVTFMNHNPFIAVDMGSVPSQLAMRTLAKAEEALWRSSLSNGLREPSTSSATQLNPSGSNLREGFEVGKPLHHPTFPLGSRDRSLHRRCKEAKRSQSLF